MTQMRANPRAGGRARGLGARDKGRGTGLAFTGQPARPFVAVPDATYTKNWPASAPTRSHQRVVGRHTARAQTGRAFLKGWGSTTPAKQARRAAA